jgi:hypothetical protein
MKIVAYIISLFLSSAAAALLTFPIAMLTGWVQVWFHKERPGFWLGFWLADIESFILVMLSRWIFSWFNFSLPIFFIIIITLLLFLNNGNRYNTRPNKPKEMGYWIGQLIGIPLIYWQVLKGDGIFVFW